MNKYIAAIFFILNSCMLQAQEIRQEVKISWQPADKKMRHFRDFSDISKKERLCQIGAQDRGVSGSGQFTKDNVLQINDAVSKSELDISKIIVIDLREEPHGFIQGLPVSLKVKEREALLPSDELVAFENDLLNAFLDSQVFVQMSGKTENELVKEAGFEYLRFPVIDHSFPTDQIVQEFIDLIKNEPSAWIHVHCSAGKGRTTTFLCMYDIIFNAKEVSFHKILTRQREIDGQDLIQYEKKPHPDSAKQKLYAGRISFLRNFYRYCKEEDIQSISWIEWKEINRISLDSF